MSEKTHLVEDTGKDNSRNNPGFCNILKDECGKSGGISALTAGTFVVGEVAGTGILALPLALSQTGKKLLFTDKAYNRVFSQRKKYRGNLVSSKLN